MDRTFRATFPDNVSGHLFGRLFQDNFHNAFPRLFRKPSPDNSSGKYVWYLFRKPVQENLLHNHFPGNLSWRLPGQLWQTTFLESKNTFLENLSVNVSGKRSLGKIPEQFSRKLSRTIYRITFPETVRGMLFWKTSQAWGFPHLVQEGF